MSEQPIRFLHASDLRLDVPACGLEAVPDHLAEMLVRAPLDAARNLFDAARQQPIDFLAIVGELIDFARSGPREYDFLLGEFDRLHDAGVTVYWSAGLRDGARHAPPGFRLPPNVHRFESSLPEVLTYRRGTRSVATIVGCAALDEGRWRIEELDRRSDLPTIALVPGPPPQGDFDTRNVHCWALGGRTGAQVLSSEPIWAGYCGTHQGRDFDESGSHGAALMEVGSHGQVKRRFIRTDVAIWCDISVEIPAAADASDLLHRLRMRTLQLRETSEGRQCFVRWRLMDADSLNDTPGDAIAARLREGSLAAELLLDLRREFGMTIPGVWHVDIQAEPPRVLPTGWYEERTVLGDLLRSVQRLQQHPDELLPGQQRVLPLELPDGPPEELRTHPARDRDRMLRQLAVMGVDLLRGDRVLSPAAQVPS